MGKFDETMRPDLSIRNEAPAVSFTLGFPAAAGVGEIVDARAVQVEEPAPPFSLDPEGVFPALPAPPPSNGNGHGFAEPGAIRKAYLPGAKAPPSLRQGPCRPSSNSAVGRSSARRSRRFSSPILTGKRSRPRSPR